MKPSMIYDVLNLAVNARKQGNNYNPLFVGAPGLGKSEIVQAWCRENDMQFIDLRAAFLEAPDVIGFPSIETRNGRQITVHNTPEFWPSEGNGVLFLDEVNRGTTSVMNTFMQLLTDRRIHNYTLPEGWIIVSAINPENEEHDVNTMDAALKDRFEIFQIDYDQKDFLKFMRSRKWDQAIVSFIETKTWTYALPENISKADGSKYISPRTFSKLNTAIKAGISQKLEKIVYETALGRNVGMAFYHFKNNEQPVTYSELANEETLEGAIEKLKAFGNPKTYKAGSIAVTIRDIVDNNEIVDDLLAKVVLALPADQGPVLIRELSFKRKDEGILSRLVSNYPEVKKYLKSVLRQA